MWVYEKEAKNFSCSQQAHSCKGQHCMAWRWGYVNKIDDPNFEGESFAAAEVGVPEGKFPSKTRFRARKGYCGLAGIPSTS